MDKKARVERVCKWLEYSIAAGVKQHGHPDDQLAAVCDHLERGLNAWRDRAKALAAAGKDVVGLLDEAQARLRELAELGSEVVAYLLGDPLGDDLPTEMWSVRLPDLAEQLRDASDAVLREAGE